MNERIVDIEWCLTHESFQVNPGFDDEDHTASCWSWEMGYSTTTDPFNYPRDCEFVQAQVHVPT